MRWIGFVLLVIILQSCEKELSEVSFRVKVDGFTLKDDTYFPQSDTFGFKSRYCKGVLSFTSGEKRYEFAVGEDEIDGCRFWLPEGEYLMEMEVEAASLYGQPNASFLAEPKSVKISERTDTISIEVTPNCSLVFISDADNHLDKGPFFIERHSYAYGYFIAYPMKKDTISGLYYAYFTPDPDHEDPSAFLWFYGETPGEEKGGMPTSLFDTGYRYFISVLE